MQTYFGIDGDDKDYCTEWEWLTDDTCSLCLDVLNGRSFKHKSLILCRRCFAKAIYIKEFSLRARKKNSFSYFKNDKNLNKVHSKTRKLIKIKEFFIKTINILTTTLIYCLLSIIFW